MKSLLAQSALFQKLAQKTERSHQPTLSRQPTINYFDDRGDELESKRISDTMIIHAARKFGLDIRLLDAIDQGRYSKAFLYKNHVVKFTLSHLDVNALLRLDALRGKLKNEKHLLKIFNVDHDPDTGLYMMEVERLEPLDGHIRMMLFSAPRYRPLAYEMPQNTFAVLKNGEVIMNLLHMAWKNLAPDIREALEPDKRRMFLLVLNHFANVSQRLLKEEIDRRRQEKATNKQIKRPDLDRVIMALLMDTVKLLSDKLPNASYNDISEFMHRLHYPLANVLKERFPEEIDQYDASPTSSMQYSTLPESRSVVEFLEELKRMGVNWKDLHGANLMQRPKTKDIVISDPGLFEFKE